MICVNVYQLFPIKLFDCCIMIRLKIKITSLNTGSGCLQECNLISISHLQKNIHKLHVMVVRFFYFGCMDLKMYSIFVPCYETYIYQIDGFFMFNL